MRKPIYFALLLAALWVACDSESPTGPSTVTIEELNPPQTTTTVPPGGTTTVGASSSTTTIPTPATTRTYVAFGPVAPNVPSQLTLFLQPLGARAVASLANRIPFIGTQQDEPLRWTVEGFYVTSGGGGGQVSGELIGTLDQGNFTGSLTSEAPECTAEREFGGSLDPQFLRWNGGRTLRDCKGSPLGFNSLVMIATAAPAPTTTAISSSTTTAPVQCSFSLSADGVSVNGSGGQATVGVTTGPNCNWTVQNFVPWIRAQPATGTGSATVSLTVEANPGEPRSATLVIAGLPFVVNQGLPTTTSVPAFADLLPIPAGGNFCRFSDGALLVDIRNQGTAAAPSSVARVFFDGGRGATFVDRVAPNLPTNSTNTLVFTIPESCFVANCQVLIAADALSTVQESNEGNNSVNATCDFLFEA
jgi:hypothetical protein